MTRASEDLTVSIFENLPPISRRQDKFIMRKPDNADVGLGEDYEEVVAGVGRDADLYVVNQGFVRSG